MCVCCALLFIHHIIIAQNLEQILAERSLKCASTFFLVFFFCIAVLAGFVLLHVNLISPGIIRGNQGNVCTARNKAIYLSFQILFMLWLKPKIKGTIRYLLV